MGLVLTASYRRAPAAVAVAELLRREGTLLSGVLVSRSLNLKRIRALIRQRGLRATMKLTRRIRGISGNPESRVLQEMLATQNIEEKSIDQWCDKHKVHCKVVSSLNAQQAVQMVQGNSVEGVIYTGGGIIRSPFIDAVHGRVLNAHAGKLPEVRGMNACEWSIFLDIPMSVTIHLINSGIDTGHILETVPLRLENSKDNLNDLRQRCVVAGIEGLVRNAKQLSQIQELSEPPPPTYRQCYVMAPAMLELTERKLIQKLSQGRTL